MSDTTMTLKKYPLRYREVIWMSCYESLTLGPRAFKRITSFFVIKKKTRFFSFWCDLFVDLIFLCDFFWIAGIDYTVMTTRRQAFKNKAEVLWSHCIAHDSICIYLLVRKERKKLVWKVLFKYTSRLLKHCSCKNFHLETARKFIQMLRKYGALSSYRSFFTRK